MYLRIVFTNQIGLFLKRWMSNLFFRKDLFLQVLC